jgi:very-short-patch-repair endonuclease
MADGAHLFIRPFDQRRYDRKRDQWLEKERGIRTIRFTNREILKTPEAFKARVMEAITL